jgi:hypothetical protein
MSLLTLPFRLPLLPVRALIQLGEVILDRAEQELYDPAAVRRQLEELEEAHQAGELSSEEVAEAEHRVIGRLVTGTVRPAPPAGPDDEEGVRS